MHGRVGSSSFENNRQETTFVLGNIDFHFQVLCILFNSLHVFSGRVFHTRRDVGYTDICLRPRAGTGAVRGVAVRSIVLRRCYAALRHAWHPGMCYGPFTIRSRSRQGHRKVSNTDLTQMIGRLSHARFLQIRNRKKR